MPASIVSSVLVDFYRSEIMVEDAAVELGSLFIIKIITSYTEKIRLLCLKQQLKFGTIVTIIHRDSVVITVFWPIGIFGDC